MFDVACALAAVKLDAATDDEASERCKFGKSSSVCCEYCSLVKADGTLVLFLRPRLLLLVTRYYYTASF